MTLRLAKVATALAGFVIGLLLYRLGTIGWRTLFFICS
jgi:hypothetical protein